MSILARIAILAQKLRYYYMLRGADSQDLERIARSTAQREIHRRTKMPPR